MTRREDADRRAKRVIGGVVGPDLMRLHKPFPAMPQIERVQIAEGWAHEVAKEIEDALDQKPRADLEQYNKLLDHAMNVVRSPGAHYADSADCRAIYDLWIERERINRRAAK